VILSLAAEIAMSPYDLKPTRFFKELHDGGGAGPLSRIYCAGFELGRWRGKQMATHLIEWLPDYALAEEELLFHHGNAYINLRKAAVRIYTSSNYEKRGEAGEITLHAICRDFFGTIPIAPRVFYKSSSNDPIKSFDLVHARFPDDESFEIWLGEAKFYKNRAEAISAAISSIKTHIEQGFLTREKLLLGPQISRKYEQIMRVFEAQTSIDEFLNAAVFVIGIVSESEAAATATRNCKTYLNAATAELAELAKVLREADFEASIRLALIYVPMGNKTEVIEEFDRRLKGLQ
jgi:hypothetical protein